MFCQPPTNAKKQQNKKMKPQPTNQLMKQKKKKELPNMVGWARIITKNDGIF